MDRIKKLCTTCSMEYYCAVTKMTLCHLGHNMMLREINEEVKVNYHIFSLIGTIS